MAKVQIIRFLIFSLLCFTCAFSSSAVDCKIEAARSQIGVHELSGKNDGKQVETYLHYANSSKGAPWCAAFVSWCHGQCGIFLRNAYSPALFPNSKTVYTRGLGTYNFNSGDVFGLFFPNMNRIAHVGMIESVFGNTVITIEGNTNQAGSREGDGVYRKRRPLRTIYKIARWS
jgi:hypothetical protein